ncbi:hypothetical protein LA66_08535 [Aureimonas altamirensis]|uniref:Proteophosphoglycan n=2 Tax=Aureimonas altamirensis TaxID=370622 RepID=A0A0B1Q6V7_9HYPH|nr:hypothetical protein LA66_08535 [Aureimonas altamirensis]
MGEDGSGTVAGLAALMARAERADASPAPVERWHPAHCGDIDIVIRADGSWVHEGAVIGRPELVRLFSTVLRKDEDGETYLVTPAERLRITVEDAPFLAVEMAVEDGDGCPVLTFRTNMGDVVRAGAEHPIRFGAGPDGFVPYVTVRGRLEARLTRPVAFELAGLLHEDETGPYLMSGGVRFQPAPAAS